MSNSKLLQKWFESAKRPVGFSFKQFKDMLQGLDYIDILYRKGVFKRDGIANMKLSYLRRYE